MNAKNESEMFDFNCILPKLNSSSINIFYKFSFENLNNFENRNSYDSAKILKIHVLGKVSTVDMIPVIIEPCSVTGDNNMTCLFGQVVIVWSFRFTVDSF